MKIGVVKETFPGEHRVAMVPSVLSFLAKSKAEVLVQAGAGFEAGFSDQDYAGRGATIVAGRDEVFREAEVIIQVRTAGANPSQGGADIPLMREGQTMIGLADPLGNSAAIEAISRTGARCFSLELLPRITRAQGMDVLSSQATVAGYKAALLAASHLPRMFPMMMTAAGTVPAAKVFVIGAGVAGLQAIASSRKAGAVVQAYDVRPVVKEQIQSLGAKFLEIELSSAVAEGQGGYAKEMDESFYRKQQELMSVAVSHSDAVITTAAVPGARAPVLVTQAMVRGMQPGSVIIDLAARMGQVGGNCEITQPDQTIIESGVTILGPTNLPATVPQTASQLYARNIAMFLLHLIKDGVLTIDMSDEITAKTLLCEAGQVVHERLKAASASVGLSAINA